MTEQIHILYIDDNPMDRALVRHSLEREHSGFILTEAGSKKEFEKLIHKQTFDLVLTDFNILGFEGLQVLATIQSVSPETPVIIVTGTGSEEVAVEAMKQGAGDYVIKTTSHINRLPKTILLVLETKRIRNEKEKAQKELTRMNRVYAFISEINQLIVRIRDREKLFRESCNIAIEFGKFRLAWIGLVDEENKIVKPFYWSGHEDGYLKKIKTIRIDDSPESKGPTGTAVRTGKYSLCNNIAEDQMITPWRSEALQRGYHSSIALPVKLDSKVIGTFNLYSDEPNFFYEQEIVLLEEVVDDISFALNSLHAEAERQLAENTILQERTLLRTLIDNLPNGIFVKDKEYRKIIANPIHTEEVLGHLKYLGLNPDIDIIGKTDFEIFPKELAEKFYSEDQKVIRDGHSIINNVEFGIQPDGKKIWFLTSKVPLYDKDGSVTGMIGITNDITKSKQAEDELRKREMRHQTILRTAMDGFWRLDLKGHLLEVNKAYCRMSGYSEQELLAMSVTDLETIEKPADTAAHMQRVLTQGEDRFESRHRCKDGSVFTLDISVQYIAAEGGYMVAFLRDITERRQALETLRASEAQLSIAMEISKLGYWEYDVAEDLFTFNDHFYDIFRTSAEKAGGYKMSPAQYAERFLHPDDRVLVANEMKKAFETTDPDFSQTLEHRIIYANGEIGYISVHYYIVKDEQGRTIKTYGANQDITERKQAEKEIQVSAERWHNTFNSITDIVAVISRDHEFLEINEAGCKSLGLTKTEIIGKKCYEIVHQSDSPIKNCPCQRAMDSKKMEVTEYTANGLYYILTAWPIFDDNNDVIAFSHAIKDITEQKRMETEKLELEDKFRESQKMESIGNLAGGIAHDFNNLLTVIQGHAQMAMMSMDESNLLYKDLTQIMKSSTRAANLTRQLLLFSRKQDIELKTLDLNQTIQDLYKMLQRLIGENISIDTKLAPDLSNVEADEGNIEQVIMNLAVNARDAMPDGGKLTITTENVSITNPEQITLPGSRIGNFVRISVADTGCGIPKEILGKIFEPFFSTKEKGKGTGLGLSVVYGIVRSHGGWINVYSEAQHGTVFNIYLPVSTKASLEKGSAKTEFMESLHGNGEQILVIEDERGILDFAASALRQFGYIVSIASDGQQAKAAFEEAEGNFQLIMSDVILPDINGFDLATKLIKDHPNIPVLMCSGYTEERVKRSIIQERGFTFLQKPYSLNDLLVKVKNALLESGK